MCACWSTRTGSSAPAGPPISTSTAAGSSWDLRNLPTWPTAMLARELGCVVVAAGYRVAPETVFPGNVEDCYAALKWLHANAADWAPIPPASPSAERAPAADWQRPWRCWRAIAAKCQSSTSNSSIRCWTIGARPAAIRSPANSAGRASETVSAGLACLVRNPAARKFRLTRRPPGRESGRSAADLHRRGFAGPVPRGRHRLRASPDRGGGAGRVACLSRCVPWLGSGDRGALTKAHARDQLAALRAAFAR